MLSFIKLPKYSYVRFLSDYINIDEVVLRLEEKGDVDMIEYFFYLVDILRKEKVDNQAMIVKNVFLNIENYKSYYDMWYIISTEEIFFIDRINNDVVIIPVDIKCQNCKEENKKREIKEESSPKIEIIKSKRKYTRKSKEPDQIEVEVKPKRKYTRKNKNT